jgi:hypothetical protein
MYYPEGSLRLHSMEELEERVEVGRPEEGGTELNQ